MRALLLTLLVAVPIAAQVFLPARRIAPSVAASLNPTNGLVAYWKMEEASGNPREDSWSTHDLVEAVDPVSRDTGKVLFAAEFVGLPKELSIASTNFQAEGVTAFSWAGWAFLDSKTAPRVIASKYAGGGANSIYRLRYNNTSDRFEFGVWTNELAWLSVSASTLGSPAAGSWYYLVAGRNTNNSTIFISVNGGARDTAPLSSSLSVAAGAELEVGAQSSGAEYMIGRVDELGFWKTYSLTDEDIDFLYNDGYGATLTAGVFVQQSPSTYTANTAVFDGTNDYMEQTSSGPTGLADGKTLTFSAWAKFDAGGDGATQYILAGGAVGAVRFYVRKTTGNLIQFVALNSTPTIILNVLGTTTITAATGWVHLYGCFDLADTAKRKIYVNGVSETLTVSTYTDDTIDFVGTSFVYRVGGETSASPTGRLNAALAEVWWNDSYLDTPASFASGGDPISLGLNGSIPTGSAPVFYLKNDGNNFFINSGTGENFTITGSLGTTTPP